MRLCKYSLNVLHIGVGFGVARFTELGNAKASMRGTSDRYRFPRFFILNTHLVAVVGNRARQRIEIMKKFFVSLVMLLSLSAASVFAQSSLIATLSHEGEITMFYGAYALRDAHKAAKDGDAITLSSGLFYATDITKAITLRGAGMELDSINNIQHTEISGNFIIQIPDTLTERLKIEGIYHKDVIKLKGTLRNPQFVKCRLYTLDSSTSADGKMVNGSVVHCKIVNSFHLTSTGSDCSIVNSYVCNASCDWVSSTTSNMHFLNSIIVNGMNTSYYRFFELDMFTFNNCILYGYATESYTNYYKLPSNALAYNCVGYNGQKVNTFANISNTTNTMASSLSDIFKTFTGKYSDTETFELTDAAKAKYLGDDGTQVGIHGGSVPYTPITMKPKITKCNVASKSTADGKLSVDIEVTGAE